MKSFDVIVVGLGAVGSATLYHLARQGASVLGIDRHAPPHDRGSTHGDSRITRLSVGEGEAYLPFARRSHEIWRELETKSGQALLFQHGGYVIGPRSGGARFHGRGSFVANSVAFARRFQIAHELRSAAEVRNHHPQVNIQDHEHAYYEPTGGVVYPEGAIAVQLSQAHSLGAQVNTLETVLETTEGGDSVTVITDKGRYTAARIVLSAGPWIADFLPSELQPSHLVYRQVMHWFEVEDVGLFRPDHFPFLIWIGQTLDDYFCVFPIMPYARPALKMMTERYLSPTHPEAVKRTVARAEIAQMADEFIPSRLNGVTRRHVASTTCLFTVTPDEHFLLDWLPESQRRLYVSACSGHGFKHSAALGESVAQLILTGSSERDLSFFGFNRFVAS